MLVKGSDFVFDSNQLLYCKCHRIILRHGGSYINFPDWMKKMEAKINPKNKDDKGFQYALTVALNYREIESHSERFLNIKPVVNKYNAEGINYWSKIDDSKTFDKNNPATALNISYVKEKEICSAYISKINSKCKKQKSS